MSNFENLPATTKNYNQNPMLPKVKNLNTERQKSKISDWAEKVKSEVISKALHEVGSFETGGTGDASSKQRSKKRPPSHNKSVCTPGSRVSSSLGG